MTTHDIELPPLPPLHIAPSVEPVDYPDVAQALMDYARAAIVPYAKHIAQLEAARFAYASEFPPDENGDPDVGSIHENIRKLKAELEADRKRRGEPVELQGVPEALSNGDGFWRSCSGCHESNEGHATGPYSKTLQCHLGVGCRECGGIGAIWDDTDYDAMADYMARDMSTPQPAEPVIRNSRNTAEPVKVPSDADAKHIQDFIACDGMGAVIVEGPQYSAVVRALLSRYGKGTP